MSDFMQHAPALIVAIPLLLAFLTPVLAKSKAISADIRNGILLAGLAVVLLLVLGVAQNVYDDGTQTYIFGADDPAPDMDDYQYVDGVLVERNPHDGAFFLNSTGSLVEAENNTYYESESGTFVRLENGSHIERNGIYEDVGGRVFDKANLDGGDGYAVRIWFSVDGLSALMAILVALTSIVAFLYSDSFLSRYKDFGMDKYYTVVLLLTAGSFGMVLTGDLFNFFVFLEVASIAACGLIAFRVDKAKSIEAALKYMMVSTIGALMFLVSLGILYGQYGSLNMGYLAANITLDTTDQIALGLIVASFAMKAGAVPMHMATPDAYGAAPAPVTVLVMMASEAVLYGIIRICATVFGMGIVAEQYDRLGIFLIILGVLSMFVGASMALAQRDLKRMMAYSAVSQAGYIFVALGVAFATYFTTNAYEGNFGEQAMQGAIFHMFNHVLYMSLLFLIAGAVYYRTRTTDLNKLGGLGHDMKYTMWFFLIGGISIAGLPPAAGFSSKFLIYESIYLYSPLLTVVALLVSVMTLAVFTNIFYSVFLGPRQFDGLDKKVEKSGELPRPMLASMGILVVLIIFTSLFPGVVLDWIIDPAVEALKPVVMGGGA